MKKFLTIVIAFVILAGIFAPSGVAFGQTGGQTGTLPTDLPVTQNTNTPSVTQTLTQAAIGGLGPVGTAASLLMSLGGDSCGMTNPKACIMWAIKAVCYIILTIMGWLLWLAGVLLNLVLIQTVGNMAANIANMSGINIAWKVIRDVINMFFIFLLVYNAILVIISKNTKDDIKKIITGIIITALLINFSMFFTKVIIDASNIVTVGFYNSIINSGQQTVLTTSSGSANNTSTIPPGISGAFANAMHITSFFSTDGLGNGTTPPSDSSMIIIYLFGSVLFLVLAFVLFAISIMFVIRYIAFLLLLMFSPLGFTGFGLPQLKSIQSSWWDTLLGQAVFAPLYMFLTWVILTLMASPGFIPQAAPGSATLTLAAINTPGAQQGAIGLLINFVVIIGLVIFSLTESKKWAGKGATQVKEYTAKLTAFAGSAVMGSAAAVGRNSIGRMANAAANDKDLRDKAAAGDKWAQLKLKTYRKTADSSFDVRRSYAGEKIAGATGVNFGKGTIFNEKAGQGGYKKTREDKDKKELDYAKSLEPTDEEKRKDKEQTEAYLNSDEYKNSEQYKKAEAEKKANEEKLKPETERADKIKTELDKLNKAEKERAEKSKEDLKKLEEEKKTTTNPLALSGIERDIAAKKQADDDAAKVIKAKEEELAAQNKKVEEVKKSNAENSTEQKVREMYENEMRQDLKSKRANDYADSIEKRNTLKEAEEKIRAKGEAQKTLGSDEFIKNEEQEKIKHLASKEYEKQLEILRKSTVNEEEFQKAKAAYEKAWISKKKKELIAMNGGQVQKKDESGNITQQWVGEMTDDSNESWMNRWSAAALNLTPLQMVAGKRSLGERKILAAKLRKSTQQKSYAEQIADLTRKDRAERKKKAKESGGPIPEDLKDENDEPKETPATPAPTK